MKRRLTDVYDHMTMPESCAQRIENRLQLELQSKETGGYTKLVSPHDSHRGGWRTAAACLLLVLAMSGAVLYRWMGGTVVDVPTEAATGYALVTELSTLEVESFASGLRQNVQEENWEAFSRKIKYPIIIDDKTVTDRRELVELITQNSVSKAFTRAIQKESCSGMFCNWQGICMGDGQLWFNEIDGDLKVTAINGLFANMLDPENFVLKLLPDGNYTVAEYAGQEPVIVFPAGTSKTLVTTIGTGQPVITSGGDQIETIWIPATIKTVRENAFANCPALKAVYFEGDAPPEAEGVFEGSENVTVYYRKDTQGWGATWCGRQTREYSSHISLGTVTVPDRVPALFEDILSGAAVLFYGYQENLTVEECCAALWGDGVKPEAFTLVDMDDDGVCELIFSPQDGEGMRLGYLVLRQDGKSICRYTVSGRDLRKDGTFYSYVLKGDSRIYIQDETSFVSIESADFTQQDKPLAQWHTYPCKGAALVLESYRYASETGFSTHPGSPYYYLGTLLSGEAEWSVVQPWLAQQSVYVEEKGTFYAFDPDAPGCLMYGTLIGTGEQKELTALGYYICDETREYRAEAFDLDTSKPVYTVDPPPDDRGRVVESVEAMQDYFSIDFYGAEIPRDTQQIAELLDQFVYWYAIHDTKGMQECMAETAKDLSSYPFTGNVSILTYGILPGTSVNVGESWHTSVELLESGESKNNYHLAVELIKQTDGWKIQSYGLEKQ